jgi:hypothetical protein
MGAALTAPPATHSILISRFFSTRYGCTSFFLAQQMDFCYVSAIQFRLHSAASNLPLVSSFLISILAGALQFSRKANQSAGNSCLPHPE